VSYEGVQVHGHAWPIQTNHPKSGRQRHAITTECHSPNMPSYPTPSQVMVTFPVPAGGEDQPVTVPVVAHLNPNAEDFEKQRRAAGRALSYHPRTQTWHGELPRALHVEPLADPPTSPAPAEGCSSNRRSAAISQDGPFR
jgi:hypothetical protein